MKIMNSNFMIAGLMFLSINLSAQQTSTKLTDYVNPFIGTVAVDCSSLSGSNFPGATVPFGFVQLSPDTKDGFDGESCSGYNYKDKTVVGFSHTHLSGTGVADLFDVLLMPATGDMKIGKDKASNNITGYISKIDHQKESAKPGYYQVNLLDYNINAELTATEHAGFHRYTFPQSSQSHILIDMNHSSAVDIELNVRITSAQIKIINNHTIEGYRSITGWTDGCRRVYFRAEFSRPIDSNDLYNSIWKTDNHDYVNGSAVKALFNFNTKANETILVKVGLSATSIENARLNL